MSNNFYSDHCASGGGGGSTKIREHVGVGGSMKVQKHNFVPLRGGSQFMAKITKIANFLCFLVKLSGASTKVLECMGVGPNF